MSLRQTVLRRLPPGVLVFLAGSRKRLTRNWKGPNSFLDEERIIRSYMARLQPTHRYCVDIAASDGISSSNTYALFKEGWSGLAAEVDPTKFAMLAIAYRKFSNVNLVKTKVLPETVTSILRSCECPRDFALLSLDLDGYDFFILDNLLGSFRPRLICAEINENIPPPLRFSVKYDIDHSWSGDHFHGQSISKCYELCEKYGYEIVELNYNNLFLVPRELNTFGSLSPEEAYETGYRGRSDRREKFPWNDDMEELLAMPREEGLRFVREKFRKYDGRFIVE